MTKASSSLNVGVENSAAEQFRQLANRGWTQHYGVVCRSHHLTDRLRQSDSLPPLEKTTGTPGTRIAS